MMAATDSAPSSARRLIALSMDKHFSVINGFSAGATAAQQATQAPFAYHLPCPPQPLSGAAQRIHLAGRGPRPTVPCDILLSEKSQFFSRPAIHPRDFATQW
jgi:hypothetical protein